MAEYKGVGHLHIGDDRVRVAYLIRTTGDAKTRRADGTILGFKGDELSRFLDLPFTTLETDEHGDLEVLPSGDGRDPSSDRASIAVNTQLP